MSHEVVSSTISFFFALPSAHFREEVFFFVNTRELLGQCVLPVVLTGPFVAYCRRRRRRANKNYDEFNSAGPFMNSTASLSLRKLNIKEYKTARGAFVFAAVVAAPETHTTHNS